jgi:hypothetical protein
MFGVAATSSRYERRAVRRLSTWTRDYLRKAALADLGCAVVGVFMAAQIRFGGDVTSTYLALSLALPVLWLAALWLAGAYDVRFIGTGSDEFRKVLNAGVGLAAAIAVFSYVINLELSRGYVVIVLATSTVIDLVSRYAIRMRLHKRHDSGHCLLTVAHVTRETAVADPLNDLGRDQYHGLASDGDHGGLRLPARPRHGLSRYSPMEPFVPRVRHSITACLKAHNCALPGAQSQDCDQGTRPVSHIQGGAPKDAAAER